MEKTKHILQRMLAIQYRDYMEPSHMVYNVSSATCQTVSLDNLIYLCLIYKRIMVPICQACCRLAYIDELTQLKCLEQFVDRSYNPVADIADALFIPISTYHFVNSRWLFTARIQDSPSRLPLASGNVLCCMQGRPQVLRS